MSQEHNKGERISAWEFARRSDCDRRQVRRALVRGALSRGADGKIDAALRGSSWRKPNRRTLEKTAHCPRDDAATDTRVQDDETPANTPTVNADVPVFHYTQALAMKEHYAALL